MGVREGGSARAGQREQDSYRKQTVESQLTVRSDDEWRDNLNAAQSPGRVVTAVARLIYVAMARRMWD